MSNTAVEENSKLQAKRVCSKCGSDKTTTIQIKRKDGSFYNPYPLWRRDGKGGWLCKPCWNRYVSAPLFNPINNPKLICFKEKRLIVKEEPRCGVCNWCRAVAGEINAQTGELCKITARAHISYHKEYPLKDTIELCVSCHNEYDRGIPYDRQCCICGSNKTYTRKDGAHSWFKGPNEGEFVCSKCRKKQPLILQ